MKECTKCKNQKPLEEFNFKIKERNLRHSHCKDCTRLFVKNHYNRNREYYLAKAQKRNKYLRYQINSYISNYLLNHPCVGCGEKDLAVLEFDYTGQVPKLKAVSHLIKDQVSLAKIQEEINKCVVRCANCHRKKTAKDFNWFRIQMPL